MIDPLEGKAARAAQPPTEATVIAFDGAVRSSKTVVSLLMWVKFIVCLLTERRTGALAMIGRTEASIIRNAVMPLQEMLGAKRVVLNRGLGIVTILGREVYLFGANDVQARTKIQGLTLVGAYVDEAANIPEEFFNMLRSRLSAAGAMLYMTMNPEGPKHWLLTKWLNRARWWLDRDGQWHEHAPGDLVDVPDDQGDLKPQPVLNWYRVTFLLGDNTWLARNNPQFVADLIASFPKGGVFYRRYIGSEWVSAEGSVYPMFDEDVHTIALADLPPVEQVYYAAVDYGTNHRTRGYLLGLIRPNTDRITGQPIYGPVPLGRELGPRVPVLVVLSEFAPGTATVGQHAREFLEWLQGLVHYGEPIWLAVDPAAATFKMELFDMGLSNVMNAHNAVVPGIQVVQSLFTMRRMVIVREANPQLLKMLPGYMWDTKATERGATAPIKKNDDEVDALRYVVYTSWSEWRGLIPLAGIAGRDDEPEEFAG